MEKKPQFCFIGPMVGRNSGYVTTQGEILADQFAAIGYPVISASAASNRYVRLLEILMTLLRQGRKVDVQCLQVYGGPSFVVEDLASQLGRWHGQRVVMILRGGAMPEFMARHPRWVSRVLRRADAIVVPSPFLARALANYGFHARIIPNVVDRSAYPFCHRRHLRPRLFWMRAFHPAYNPEMAVRVLARVQKQAPEATLVIAGQDKGIQRKVQELARELGVNESVRFPGFLDVAAKIREGGAADIFLNTNRVDNMPVAIIEACAMGLPVVATAVGGISDLLTNGETGWLVPDNDDHAMAAAVLRLLHDPDLAGRLSANGRRLAERSFWDHVRPQWEKLFAEVMAPARPKSKAEQFFNDGEAHDFMKLDVLTSENFYKPSKF